MSRASRLGATLVVLVVCAACDRAEPDASFRNLTDPFDGLHADCWPFLGAAPFTTPWFTRSLEEIPGGATLEIEVFDSDASTVTQQLDSTQGLSVTVGDTDDPVRVTVQGPTEGPARAVCSN